MDAPDADRPRRNKFDLSTVREIRDGDRVITPDMPEWPNEFRRVAEWYEREPPDPLRERRRAIAWAPWAIVESAIEVARRLADPDDLDRSMDTLVATLRLVLGKSRFRTTLRRSAIKPDRTGRLVLRQ